MKFLIGFEGNFDEISHEQEPSMSVDLSFLPEVYLSEIFLMQLLFDYNINHIYLHGLKKIIDIYFITDIYFFNIHYNLKKERNSLLI